MDLFEAVDKAAALARANPLMALAAGLIILYLFYRKPGISFFVIFLAGLLAVIYFTIMSMSSSGSAGKERLIKKGSAPDMTSIDPRQSVR